MVSFSWTCPFCGSLQTVVSGKFRTSETSLIVKDQSEGPLGLSADAIACANPTCRRTTITVTIANAMVNGNGYMVGVGTEVVVEQRILPQGTALPQPDYIPTPIREDYYEACLIRDLSPKASATLVRRCLQGMIRDFAGISKGTLFAEIDALRKSVAEGTADRSISEESIEAIDQIRSVGNIGAHMEKDIDRIVPVDPGEAQVLIELVEMLFDEWYGARERRKMKLQSIKAISEQKKLIKLNAESTAETPASE